MIFEKIPLLSLIIFLPVFGSIFIAMVDKNVSSMNTRYVALWVTATVFFMVVLLSFLFCFENTAFQFVDQINIAEKLKLAYLVGVDSLSLPFVLLTAIIFPLAIIASWDREVKNLKFFISLLLVLETLILGAFCSLNLLSFYIFFESVFIPICFISGMRDLEGKTDIPFRSIFYTLLGSVFFLVSLLKILDFTGTFTLTEIIGKRFSEGLETWLFFCFLISFITKIPIVPFHTWLPNTYSESTSSISMIISGTALKLSVYGVLRFLPFLFPKCFQTFAPWLQGLFLVSFLYTAVASYNQKYVRRFLAYLTLSQTSFALAGVFSLNEMAITGGIFNLFICSILFPGAFYITGLLSVRLNTDRIKFYGGIGQVMPQFSVVFFCICLALGGIPGSPLFIGNFLIVGGMSFSIHKIQGMVSVLGLFFYTVCLVWLYRRVIFGVITEAMVRGLKDLNLREKALCFSFVFIVFFLGIVPDFPLAFSRAFSEKMSDQVKKESKSV